MDANKMLQVVRACSLGGTLSPAVEADKSASYEKQPKLIRMNSRSFAASLILKSEVE